jgi:colanic acid/amylovoran biosynthesis protein
MGEERPLIILAGNGPYENRGCEAIVRGTVEIFRHYLDEPEFLSASFFNTHEQFEAQKERESDPQIRHIPINVFENTYSRYNPMCYFRYGICNISDWANGKILFKNMDNYVSKAQCVLSVGGDNYQQKGTKLPRNYISLDNYVFRHHIPLYLWGASVGPFSKTHDHEKYMAEHLSNVTRIFARETTTIDYLSRIGMKKNIIQVADPAFMMKPRKPSAGSPEHIPHDSLGLNFSPLMALFTTNGNLDRWREIVGKILTDVHDELGCRLFLVPHVTIPGKFNNDYLFLKSVMAELPHECDVVLVPDRYNAEELKWIISSMNVFVGARTHSTIAALSTCVPTISLSYSIKSIGINQDIFGSQEYCITPSDDYAKITTKKIVEVYHNSAQIKQYLSGTIPHFKKLSCLSGEIVSQEIQSRTR